MNNNRVTLGQMERLFQALTDSSDSAEVEPVHLTDAEFAAFSAGDLADAEKERVERHLRVCSACADEVERLRQVTTAWNHSDAGRRYQDTVALGLARVNGIPALIRLAEDTGSLTQTRRRAIAYLRRAGRADAALVRKTLSHLSEEDLDPDVRSEAASAMKELEPLQEQISRTVQSVRTFLWSALRPRGALFASSAHEKVAGAGPWTVADGLELSLPASEEDPRTRNILLVAEERYASATIELKFKRRGAEAILFERRFELPQFSGQFAIEDELGRPDPTVDWEVEVSLIYTVQTSQSSDPIQNDAP